MSEKCGEDVGDVYPERRSSWVDNGAVRVWSMLRFDWSAVAAVWPCWCRALLLIATWKKPDAESGAERPSDGSRIRTRVCAPRCCGCISGKACVNAGSVFLQLPPPPIDGTNPPRSVEPLRSFFPPSQNGSRAVGSLAVQSRSVSAEGRGKPLGLPCSLHSAEAGSLRSCYGWRSSLAPVNGEQPCGLKKQRGCHRNARLSPRLARVWHTWRGDRSSRRSGEELFSIFQFSESRGDIIRWLFQRGVVSRSALLLGGDATTKTLSLQLMFSFQKFSNPGSVSGRSDAIDLWLFAVPGRCWL